MVVIAEGFVCGGPPLRVPVCVRRWYCGFVRAAAVVPLAMGVFRGRSSVFLHSGFFGLSCGSMLLCGGGLVETGRGVAGGGEWGWRAWFLVVVQLILLVFLSMEGGRLGQQACCLLVCERPRGVAGKGWVRLRAFVLRPWRLRCCCWVGSRGELGGVCQGSVSGSYSLAQSPGVPGLAVAVLGGVWCGYVLWVDCCEVEGGPWDACGCDVGGC